MPLQVTDCSITEEEYLKGELESEVKHEYVDGYVYAMTGGTDKHATISGNIFAEMRRFLKGKKCQAFTAEMKLKTSETRFRYPDMMVICDETSQSNLYKECPVIIVEVVSGSSRRIDTITKKHEYLNISTLKEYVLIEQDFVDVEVFRKNNGWQSDHYFLGDAILFESIGLTLTVEEIYDRVDNEDMQEYLRKNGRGEQEA
ncbi:MAG: Uma2 family endonuclease [Magnetococcales bacterium]|nr:Uma2 family endonuclease [Magnetococcales bacterium]MBF0115132.1 Uma2 family endonuclease [Magnetococcales bacterium]